MGTVSVEGTKIQANASKHAAVSDQRAGEMIEQLQLEVTELMARAAQDQPPAHQRPGAVAGVQRTILPSTPVFRWPSPAIRWPSRTVRWPSSTIREPSPMIEEPSPMIWEPCS